MITSDPDLLRVWFRVRACGGETSPIQLRPDDDGANDDPAGEAHGRRVDGTILDVMPGNEARLVVRGDDGRFYVMNVLNARGAKRVEPDAWQWAEPTTTPGQYIVASAFDAQIQLDGYPMPNRAENLATFPAPYGFEPAGPWKPAGTTSLILMRPLRVVTDTPK